LDPEDEGVPFLIKVGNRSWSKRPSHFRRILKFVAVKISKLARITTSGKIMMMSRLRRPDIKGSHAYFLQRSVNIS
jgi:hypothetical protein